jgi:hypothetical protein
MRLFEYFRVAPEFTNESSLLREFFTTAPRRKVRWNNFKLPPEL